MDISVRFRANFITYLFSRPPDHEVGIPIQVKDDSNPPKPSNSQENIQQELDDSLQSSVYLC